MKIYTEISLRNYEFETEQAKSNAALLTSKELDMLDAILDEDTRCSGAMWNADDLEDLFRYDFDGVCDWIDLDVDEVYKRGE